MGTQGGEVVNAVARRYASIAMAEFITAAITFVLSNFPLTFLVIGLIVSLIAIAWSPGPVDAAVVDEIERIQEIPEPLLSQLHEARLFRMLLPRSVGGDQVEPGTTCARSRRSPASTARSAGTPSSPTVRR